MKSAICLLLFSAVTLLGADSKAPASSPPPKLDLATAKSNDRAAVDRQPLVHEARLRSELDHASPEQIRTRIVDILSRRGSPATAGDYLIAVEYLAQKSGKDAWDFVQSHPFDAIEPRPLKEAFVRGWSLGDIDAAEKWLSSSDSGWSDEDLAEMSRVLLRIDAANDGAKAMQRAFRLGAARVDPHSQQENNAMAVMDTLAHLGRFEEARAVVKTIAHDDMRNAVQANLVAATTQYQPGLAVTWYRELPPNEEKRSVLFRVVESLAMHGFSAAGDFYNSLGPEEHSADLLATLILNCTDLNRAGVSALLKDTPDSPDYDQVYAAALTRLDATTPDDVPWSWLQKIHDRNLRNGTLGSLILPRYRRDPKATRQLIEQQLRFLPAQERSAIIDRLSAATSTAGF